MVSAQWLQGFILLRPGDAPLDAFMAADAPHAMLRTLAGAVVANKWSFANLSVCDGTSAFDIAYAMAVDCLSKSGTEVDALDAAAATQLMFAVVTAGTLGQFAVPLTAVLGNSHAARLFKIAGGLNGAREGRKSVCARLGTEAAAAWCALPRLAHAAATTCAQRCPRLELRKALSVRPCLVG